MKTPSDKWQPPASGLILEGGLWRAPAVSAVSYPDAGNQACYQIEDSSYWFAHRLNCILTAVRSFPPHGTLFDIGGGNGHVARGLQDAGIEVALVEPGSGASNALQRGVRHVIQATLEDTCFHPHSLPAAGAFDVLEHVADDRAFLRRLRGHLIPGGRFYCTVPASPALWSQDDVQAGHFRRYSQKKLSETLHDAGFVVEFISPFFVWLTAPVGLLRALPSKLHLTDRATVATPTAIQSDHRLPAWFAGFVNRAQAWELARLQAGRPMPFGTSLLCVARPNGS